MASGTRLLSKPLDKIILSTISSYNMIKQEDRIIIALSGGADSVFLLHFLHKYIRYFNIQLFAFHVNHQLRGVAADSDELFCKSICEELQIPFASVSANVKQFAIDRKQSIEEAGRNIRYELLKEEMSRISCNKIATAHHADDNTESVLMNLTKGCGIDGLRGIAPILEGIIIRPLLAVSKNEIIKTLEKSGFTFRTDETNADNTFERNKIRGMIVPVLKEINPALASAVSRLTENAREVSNQYEVLLSEWEQQVVFSPINNKVIDTRTEPEWVTSASNKRVLELKIKALKLLPNNSQSAVIRHTAAKHLNLQLLKIHCDAVRELISKITGTAIELPKGYTAIRERELILISKSIPDTAIFFSADCWELSFGKGTEIDGLLFQVEHFNSAQQPNYVSSDKMTEYIDGRNIILPLIVRRWQAGDSFQPLGMKNSKKVADFLAEQRVSTRKKRLQLVVCSGSDIIWVVGFRIDERYKICENSNNILKLKVYLNK